MVDPTSLKKTGRYHEVCNNCMVTHPLLAFRELIEMMTELNPFAVDHDEVNLLCVFLWGGSHAHSLLSFPCLNTVPVSPVMTTSFAAQRSGFPPLACLCCPRTYELQGNYLFKFKKKKEKRITESSVHETFVLKNK